MTLLYKNRFMDFLNSIIIMNINFIICCDSKYFCEHVIWACLHNVHFITDFSMLLLLASLVLFTRGKDCIDQVVSNRSRVL